jgi:diguanylate cyclase (GGDEF)-like protein
LIDAVLALALGALFFACTFTFATVTNTDSVGLLNIRLLYDIQNAFIVGFAFVRYRASSDRAQRDFFKIAALVSALYMVSAAYINHMETDSDFGGFADLAIDFPFLTMFVVAARRFKRQPPATPHPVSPRFSAFVRTASPIMLPLTLFAVSCFMIFRNPWLAVAGFMAALLGHGLRSILIELKSDAERGDLERLSRIDPLTQLFNRRAFDEALSREFTRASRSGHSLSLLMIDIDHFKILNDTYGHPEGDRYLREVSRALGAFASRAGDLVARYGGEEFAIILPDTRRHAAMKVAEKLLSAVVGLALPSPASRGIVTVSIGLAAMEGEPIGDAMQLLSRADAALYTAKQSGRNQVVYGEEGKKVTR